MSPELVAALRAETPAAAPVLRDRIAAITAAAPAPRRFTTRRVLAFGAPAVAALSLLVAVAVGLSTAIDPGPSREVAKTVPVARDGAVESLGPVAAEGRAGSRRLSPALDSAGPAPTRGRAQDYRASLTLLVEGADDLSDATQRALRIARRLGGYVVSVEYATPEPGEGTAAVLLRVPVSRVQAAIVRFNGLGRIVAQDTQIADLQQGLDDLTRRIRALERRAARAKGADRERLLAQIAALRGERAQITRRAAFATVQLNLTTHEAKAPAPTPGRLHRALDDAVGILLAELAIAAYALIVASPLIVLLAAVFFGSRAYRHHADQRLLERA